MRLFLSFVIIFIFLSSQNDFSNRVIEVYNSKHLKIFIIDTNVLVNYKNKQIYNNSISEDFHLKYNEKRDVLFIEDSCLTHLNYDRDQIERYFNSSSNLIVDIEKFNDSLFVINNYILSETDLCTAVESEEYLGEDSIDYSGNTLIDPFKPKIYHSNIYNINNYQKLFQTDVARVNFIGDDIITYSLVKLDSNEWGTTSFFFDQNIYQFKLGELDLVYSTNKNDTINRKIGYLKLAGFNINVDSIYFFNDELFFLYKNNIIDIYEHESSVKPIFNETSIPLDKVIFKDIDSIHFIPLYKKAFISYQKGNKYLNFVSRADIESHKFNKLKINYYFHKGEDKYSTYYVVTFSIDSTHQYIDQNNSYINHIPQLVNTRNPIDKTYSKFGLLEYCIPTDSTEY